jgi:hypothetical protein
MTGSNTFASSNVHVNEGGQAIIGNVKKPDAQG